MKKIKKPPIERKWVLCPNCNAKTIIMDDTGNCTGVYIKCTRGCKEVFELVIKDGVQIMKTK